jgi:diketogulonate reductase-like aldo/keto reductase
MVTLPKSARRQRLVENADVGGFEISKEDMAAMDALDENLVTDWCVRFIATAREVVLSVTSY